VDAPEITDEIYDVLLEKQKRDNASEEDKLSIDKHHWKKCLGVDKIDYDILKSFEKESIQNFVSLIDEENIPKYTDDETVEKRDRVRLLKGVIQGLGFSHIFDSKTITKEQLLNAMTTMKTSNPVFTNLTNTRVRFNLSKKDGEKLDSTKSFLGFVNKLFNGYKVNIEYGRKRDGGDKKAVYKIKIEDDINELVEYKIKRGWIINDKDNIRPTATTKTYLKYTKFQEDIRSHFQTEEKQEYKKINGGLTTHDKECEYKYVNSMTYDWETTDDINRRMDLKYADVYDVNDLITCFLERHFIEQEEKNRIMDLKYADVYDVNDLMTCFLEGKQRDEVWGRHFIEQDEKNRIMDLKYADVYDVNDLMTCFWAGKQREQDEFNRKMALKIQNEKEQVIKGRRKKVIDPINEMKTAMKTLVKVEKEKKEKKKGKK
jgi:hypothetical protein